MPIIPTEREVLHLKKTHGVDDRVMELGKLLMADCQTTGDIQAKLKKLFAGTIEQMLEAEMAEHLGSEKNSVAGNNSGNSRKLDVCSAAPKVRHGRRTTEGSRQNWLREKDDNQRLWRVRNRCSTRQKRRF